jgi:hypothetical protein
MSNFENFYVDLMLEYQLLESQAGQEVTLISFNHLLKSYSIELETNFDFFFYA